MGGAVSSAESRECAVSHFKGAARRRDRARARKKLHDKGSDPDRDLRREADRAMREGGE